MSHGIGHADRSPLRNTEQDERLLRVGRRDHGLQILDPAIEGKVADVQVSHPAPALIVAHEAEVFAEEANPVPPDRALPFVLEVGQPVRGLYQHGPRTRLGPGELDTIRRAHIPDSLCGSFHQQTSLSSPEWDKCPGGMSRSIPKPGRNTHTVAAPKTPSYATGEKISRCKKSAEIGE